MAQHDNEGYNGWANWETWNVATIIKNDEYLYRTARRLRSPLQLQNWAINSNIARNVNYNLVNWPEIFENLK